MNNDLLLTRAGGGESFGGGGFDSSSSFDFDSGSSSDWDWSSSSGTGDLSGVGTAAAVGGGSCGFFVLLIIVIVVILIIKKGKGGGGSTGGGVSTPSGGSSDTGTNKSMSSEEVKGAISELKKIDPKFDQQKFKTHVKKVFMAVQEGWTERDQEVCRPFMSEEVYQSHEMQIKGMKKSKVINVLENIVVGSVDFARVDIGDEYHKITMKVRASMKDYKVKEDKPDVVIDGDKKQSPPFTEYWIFICKSNLKTKVKDGIMDRKCPNCGAPIKVSVAGECKYCDANVVNGDYDWVLSEIIQKSEWKS